MELEDDSIVIPSEDPAGVVQLAFRHVPGGREVFPLLSIHDVLLIGAYTRKDRDGVGRGGCCLYAGGGDAVGCGRVPGERP